MGTADDFIDTAWTESASGDQVSTRSVSLGRASVWVAASAFAFGAGGGIALASLAVDPGYVVDALIPVALYSLLLSVPLAIVSAVCALIALVLRDTKEGLMGLGLSAVALTPMTLALILGVAAVSGID
jgi:hypothetical protein